MLVHWCTFHQMRVDDPEHVETESCSTLMREVHVVK